MFFRGGTRLVGKEEGVFMSGSYSYTAPDNTKYKGTDLTPIVHGQDIRKY